MVADGNLSQEDYSLTCIVCGSQDRVALMPHRVNDKVTGIFCFCEHHAVQFAGATMRTEWIKDAGDVAPKDAAEALITASNGSKPKFPTLVEVQQGFETDARDSGHVTSDEYSAIEFTYDFICRKLSV